MIKQEDKDILQDVGKQYLLDIVFNSQLIKSQLSFKEHIDFCKFISELTYKEIIGLTITEDIRAFESKFKKFLKYGFAQIAGIALATGFAATVIGPPIAMFVLYTYRKLSDTCYRACNHKFPFSKERKICRYDCQVRAATKIANDLRTEMGRCSQVTKPDVCRKKLEKQYIKWVKRVQQQKTKLAKAKIGIEAKQRKQKDIEMKKRLKSIQSNFQISKSQYVDLISENEYLRDNISFHQHLKLYQSIINLKEEDPIVKTHKIDPKKEKYIRYGIYAGLFVIPIPFFNDVVNYLIKKNNVKCITKCIQQRKYSQKLCRNQCTYLSAQTAIKFLKSELPKCQKSGNPVKCQHKIQNMLGDWKQREIEAHLKYKHQLDREIAKAKQNEKQS